MGNDIICDDCFKTFSWAEIRDKPTATCDSCGGSVRTMTKYRGRYCLPIAIKHTSFSNEWDGYNHVLVPLSMYPLWMNIKPHLEKRYNCKNGTFPNSVNLQIVGMQIQRWFDTKLSYRQILRDLAPVQGSSEKKKLTTRDFVDRKYKVNKWRLT